MSVGFVTLILFLLLVSLLITGLPLAFCLGATAIILTIWRVGPEALFLVTTTAFHSWSLYTLIALPLFVLMATFLSKSDIADDLYELMLHWMGPLRGGLAMGTVIICAIFAAMSGVSAAGTVTMGLTALPSMLKRGYHQDIALGAISAGGSLGILIPPSIIMIVFASITGTSVARLFMAGFVPGLVITAIFVFYIGLRCVIQPELGPVLPKEDRFPLRKKISLLRGIFFPIILVFLVLGSIYTGITTPTEASAIGALGALVCVVIKGRFSWKVFQEATLGAFRVSVMCGWIVLGAKLFSHVYATTGAGEFILSIFSGLETNRWLILIVMQIILFLLGMFIDPIGIMMITLPVFMPIVEQFGFHPIWFGILFTVNMELAYITPPFGFNLFYLKGVVPETITMGDIYRSVIPFVVLEAIGLAIVIIFPRLSLWLPQLLLG